jgi:site-specific recombinase XerD
MMEKNTADYLEIWLRDKRYLDNLSPGSLATYRHHVHRWMEYSEGLPTPETSKAFLIHLREREKNPPYVNAICGSLNSFCTWLYQEEIIPAPVRFKKVAVKRKVHMTLEYEDVKRLIDFKTNQPTLKRTQTIVALMADCGVRIAEALAIQVSDINLEKGTIRIQGKGDKVRSVPISLEMGKKLVRHLKTNPHRCEWLFPNLRGKRQYPANCRKDFKRLCEAACVSMEGVSGVYHSLRRWFARDYLANGGNLIFLQRILGHEDLETTKIYAGDALSSQIVEAHQRISALNRMQRR